MDILKPYLEKLAYFIASQTVPLVGTAASLILIWFYSDFQEGSPLDQYEVVGFGIIIFFAFWCAYQLFRAMSKLFVLLVAGCLVSLLDYVHAGELKVVDIAGSGIHEIDLAHLSLIRFKSPFSDLELANTPSTPEEKTECLIYERSNSANFKATFCNYNKMFNKGINSIIADTEGKTAYAYDLYDLQAGGGGNFGIMLDFPSTDLKDYQAVNGRQREILCRAFLPKKPDEEAYSGFGMYAFILFRDRGTDVKRKKDIVDAYLSILPTFYSDAFGVPRGRLGVLIYPTIFDSDEIYQGFNAAGWEIGDNSDTANAIRKGYNYSFATSALKALKKVTKKNPPSISVVFLTSKMVQFHSKTWTGVIR